MDYDGENFIADQNLAKYMAYIRYLAIYSQISHILKVTKNCTRKQNIAIYFKFETTFIEIWLYLAKYGL